MQGKQLKGATHNLNGYQVRNSFADKIKITRPDGSVLWTNSFSILRDEVSGGANFRKQQISNQLTLF